MKTITKEYKVFTYDELSEEAKEKVRNMFGQDDAQIQSDMLEEDFTYKLKEDHPYFENPKFQWRLICCQGDGLSFSCKIDLNNTLTKKRFALICIEIARAIAKLIAKIIKHQASSMATTPKRVCVNGPLDLYSRITITVAAGAVAAEIAPKIKER